MKQPKNYLRKAKNWNMFMLVTSIISFIFSLIAVFTTFTDTLERYSIYEKNAQIMYEYNTGLLYRSFLLFNFVVLAYLLFCYFKANKLLGENVLAPKYPYYVAIGLMVANLVFTQLTTPNVTLVEGLEGFGTINIISSLVGVLIAAIPPIFVLVNLFKAETGEEI